MQGPDITVAKTADTGDEPVINGIAAIETSDAKFENGVVHVIDSVLFPPKVRDDANVTTSPSDADSDADAKPPSSGPPVVDPPITPPVIDPVSPPSAVPIPEPQPAPAPVCVYRWYCYCLPKFISRWFGLSSCLC
ncbi:hypothetical protein CYMTET_15248 [Cymbomonas tetramitiformis]|uniref:FAS1 domain-containing protein n=1 Tax=Cymbomonas tetramitiformis TaxID=36881 RepID=A0AAE0GEY3_9CHLO|nr:hypothetical protein CYMTET_15248 [Cymbomonas tetramitiformis]